MHSLWMLLATFLFAAMGVCVKLASDFYSTSEIVMYRGLIGTVFIFILIKSTGGTLKTRLPWHHVRRSLIGVTALWLWFYSISLLPLAMSMTLNYTAPIWMAAILFSAAWWHGHNKFEWGLAAAILASFIGITLLLQPAIQANQWLGGIIGLVSGMLSALAYLQVRQLGRAGEPEYRIVFYFSVMGAVAGLAGSIFTSLLAYFTGTSPGSEVWHAHTPYGLLLLLGIGVSAAIAQMAMTRAYRLGNTLVNANLQYTGIVFSSIWGIVIWGDVLNVLGWSGIVLIIGSGIAATFYNARRAAAPATPATSTDAIATEI